MRKLTLMLLTTVAAASAAWAGQGSDQSYFTYDDGGTIVRQASDGSEIDARVNLPVYPGDEVITNRRGRCEIRLADGNVIALDRSTDVRFRSINDSYDSDSNETVVEVRYGHVAVERTDYHREALRLDTQSASYVATNEAIYGVDTDSREADRITVFYGDVEVRTPDRTQTMHEGEQADVDPSGMFGLASSQRGTADEFERWFNRRSQRYARDNSQYLDGELAYADYDMQQYGSWTFVTSLGTWGWRPYVNAGWRPYYYGSWIYGPNNCLTWFSNEPWGWVPYHYGRWAYDPLFGWVWVPGYTYSPAWVYFAYGPGYFGWVPAGWYDCYRPYYGWAYRPYQRGRLNFGFGFNGHIRLSEIDLRPWTFIDSGRILSGRVDQAALNADAIRQRIARDPRAGMAAVSGAPARFNRNEIRDPAAAIGTIARRGVVGGGNAGVTDMTPFFRRDPDLSSHVRERIVRSAPAPVPVPAAGVPVRGLPGSGVPGPGTPGTIEGRVPPHGDSPDSPAPARDGGVVPRGDQPRATPPGDSGESNRNWRDRIARPATPGVATPSAPRSNTPPDDSWRGRVTRREFTPRNDTPKNDVPRNDSPATTPVPRDIPRRIIDRIGGARIYGEQPQPQPRSAEPQPQPQPRERTSSPPPQPAPQPPSRERASSPPPSSSSHNEGGHVDRKH